MKLEAVDGGADAFFFALLLDSHDARDAVHLDRASGEILEVQGELHARACFELQVGEEVDTARTDVASHGVAPLKPYRHVGGEPLLESSGHAAHSVFALIRWS